MDAKVIAIVGPTASGKSSLAIRLAKTLGGEILSADSRQVYRGMNIGSGKVSKREQRSVPHHLLDVADPRQQYTAAHFVRDGKPILNDILRRGKVPIVVGGTGFWIDALLRGQSIPSVPPNPKLRKRLAKLSVQKLFGTLKKLDPRRAATIDRQNPVRLIRALEIILSTKQPVPRRTTQPAYDVLWLGLAPKKKTLHRAIHRRLQQRLRHGLVAEVRRLRQLGVPDQRLLDLGLEYRYVTHYLQGRLGKPQMAEQLEREIQHYAKRQMTWFTRHKDIHWTAGVATARREAKKFLQR